MPKHRGPIAPLPSPGVSFPLTTLRELEGSLLPLRRGEGTGRGPGPAAGPRTATPPAAAQRVGRHGGERLQDRAGRFSGGRGRAAWTPGLSPGPGPPARTPARRHKARAASPSYDERHSALCFLCFLPMAAARAGRGPRAAASRAGAWPPPRGPGRPPASPRGGRRAAPEAGAAAGSGPAPPAGAPRRALPGQGAARGGFKARAGPAGREAAVAARGVRRRARSGRVPAAPGGRGAMDQAVGDLKQALPCVAEAPAVHVEVLQRGGR